MAARVLVAFASKHGSTRGIAHAVGGALYSCGAQVRVLPAALVTSVADYDAVVLGSAIYHDHWLWEGRRFLCRLNGQLRDRPLWLFSSGPIGGTPDDDLIVDRVCGLATAIPRGLVRPLGGLEILGHATFPGRVSDHALGAFEKDLPRGDWRDFRQVKRWGHLVGDHAATVAHGARSSP